MLRGHCCRAPGRAHRPGIIYIHARQATDRIVLQSHKCAANYPPCRCVDTCFWYLVMHVMYVPAESETESRCYSPRYATGLHQRPPTYRQRIVMKCGNRNSRAWQSTAAGCAPPGGGGSSCGCAAQACASCVEQAAAGLRGWCPKPVHSSWTTTLQQIAANVAALAHMDIQNPHDARPVVARSGAKAQVQPAAPYSGPVGLPSPRLGRDGSRPPSASSAAPRAECCRMHVHLRCAPRRGRVLAPAARIVSRVSPPRARRPQSAPTGRVT